MKEKNFRKAYNILYKAFSFEKEDSVKVNILKYVGLVGILGEAQHNLYSDVAAVMYILYKLNFIL
jgi:hypothetical protein